MFEVSFFHYESFNESLGSPSSVLVPSDDIISQRGKNHKDMYTAKENFAENFPTHLSTNISKNKYNEMGNLTT